MRTRPVAERFERPLPQPHLSGEPAQAAGSSRRRSAFHLSSHLTPPAPAARRTVLTSEALRGSSFFECRRRDTASLRTQCVSGAVRADVRCLAATRASRVTVFSRIPLWAAGPFSVNVRLVPWSSRSVLREVISSTKSGAFGSGQVQPRVSGDAERRHGTHDKPCPAVRWTARTAPAPLGRRTQALLLWRLPVLRGRRAFGLRGGTFSCRRLATGDSTPRFPRHEPFVRPPPPTP